MSAEAIKEYRPSLYVLDDKCDQLAQVFDSLADDPTFEDAAREAVLSFFGDAIEERDAKLDSYAGLIAHKEALAKIRKEEAKRLSDLAKTDENVVKSLKGRLKDWFGYRSITKIETRLHKFWIQDNGGVRPVTIAEGTDPEKVDKCYQRVTVSIDTEAVRADLEAGIDIPWATLGERGESLRVK